MPDSGVEFADRMGIVISVLTAERAIASMPVDGNRQVTGVMHGGAYCVLAETLGSLAANIHAGSDRVALGVDINATHTRSAGAGSVTGVCTALHLGGSLTVHEVVVFDQTGAVLSTARITNALRRRNAD
jgi:1,4-dihydroxy-2-naphthoyl-CoA hydrolase